MTGFRTMQQKRMFRIAGAIIAIFAAVFVAIVFAALAYAKDDGQFANSPLKSWFDKLSSGKGMCCSFADGRKIEDVEWGTHDGHYWVIIDGMRYAVPPDAVVKEPNRAGPAYVWPYRDVQGATQIRCFIAGAES